MIVPALISTCIGLLLSITVTVAALLTPGIAGPALILSLVIALALYGYSHLYRRHRS